MHNLILWVRYLRQLAAVRISVRTTVIVLLMLGMWVATRKMDLSLDHYLNDKLIHIIVFFGFALLMDLASSRHPFWLWKGLPLLLYGILIEFLQYFSPDRSFSVLDMLADFTGISLYFVLKMLLVWLDSRRVGNL